MIDQNWAFVITVVIYILAYFLISNPIFRQISLRIKGRTFEFLSPITLDIRTPEGRWDALMNLLVILMALVIALLFFLGSEIGFYA